MKSLLAPSILLVSLLSLSGCGTTDDIKSKEQLALEESLKLRLEMVSGDRQEAMVGHDLPEVLKVRVVDTESGKGVSDARVRFRVVRGQAIILGEPLPTTDSSGAAEGKIQLGEGLEEVWIEARIDGVVFFEDRHQVVFTAQGTPRLGPMLIPADGTANGQRAVVNTNLPVPLSVLALDEEGRPVADGPVYWSVIEGSPGVGIASLVLTDADGTASAVLSLSTVAETVRVKAAWIPTGEREDPSRTVYFVAVAEPDAPTVLRFVSGPLGAGLLPCVGEMKSLARESVVRLTDAYLNPIQGHTVRIDPGTYGSVNGGVPTASLVLVTDAAGEVRFSIASTTIGSGASYGVKPVVTATALVTAGTGPKATASFEVTRSRGILVKNPPTATYTYESVVIPPYIGLWFATIPVEIRVVNTCYAPASGVGVTLYDASRTDLCPKGVPATDWGSEDSLATYKTDSKGWIERELRLVTQSIYTDHSYAHRVRFAVSGSFNSPMIYAGPASCR